jgi:hypothetical protein
MKRVSAPGAPSIKYIPLLVQTRSNTASKCISQLAGSRRPTASPNSLDHGLQVHLQTRLITVSKCISKLARSRPRSVSPNSLDHGLQVCTIMASNCISPNSLDRGLQVHLQTRSITAINCISRLGRLRPPSSHDNGLQVHLQTRSISASEGISEFN